jgi:hypothetical protein
MAIVVVAACHSATPRADAPPEQPVHAPADCTRRIDVDGDARGATPMPIGPIDLDTRGQLLCLALDATKLPRAHFAAGGGEQGGPTGSVVLTLFDANGKVLVDGWDLTIQDTPPHTSNHLEWAPPTRAITHVRLWARARGTPARDTIHVWLFDPHE